MFTAYVVAATFDKIRAFEIGSPSGERRTGVREQLMAEDCKGREKPSTWRAVAGIPEDMEVTPVTTDMDPVEREHIMGLMETGEVNPEVSHFLQSKVLVLHGIGYSA